MKVRGEARGGMEGAWLKSEGRADQYFVGDQPLQMALWLTNQSGSGAAAPRNEAHFESVNREIKRKHERAKNGYWGFGHLSASPGPLVVVDVEDPVVARRK